MTTTEAARERIVDPGDPILVTGASGFIGSHVVDRLLARGYRNIRCLVRSAASAPAVLKTAAANGRGTRVEVIEGDLKSRQSCRDAAHDVRVVLHLAAGVAEKSFAGCYQNTVVTTRNLLEAVRPGHLKRFVNVSSFAVYSNCGLRRHALLDEGCELETDHVGRNEPYAFAKRKQEEIVIEYARRYPLPYVIVRPGAVYGPGKAELSGRVGLGTFGLFLHLGGRNRLPLTYVANCADAIVLAGVVAGVDGETFNVVDDDLPRCKDFLRAYTAGVGRFKYLSVPYPVFYAFCALWEKYSAWSEGQLPAAFNRRRCAAYWKGNRYSNRRLKERLGWEPAVSYRDGSSAYFEYVKGLSTP
jgi:nucleoside-diphosphate-sugar epimerase